MVYFFLGLTPSVLRPKDAKKCSISHEIYTPTSYRVVKLDSLGKLVTEVVNGHRHTSPDCTAEIIFPEHLETTLGLATSFGVRCLHCKYKLEATPLYSRISVGGTSQRGHAELNVRLAAWHITHGVSLQATVEIAAFLDIPILSESGLRNLIEKVKGPLMDAGLETLHDNRKLIGNLLKIMNETELHVATDSAYNNPAKGRAFQANGSQCTSPMTELLTKKQLVVSLVSLSQQCTCQKGMLDDSECKPTCPANVPLGENLGSYEAESCKTNLKNLEADGLKVTCINADGSNIIMSRVDKGILKEECTVHVSRAQRRKAYAIEFFYIRNSAEKNRVSHDIVDICKREMVLGRRKYCHSDKLYIQHMEKARLAVVSCLQGKHSKCKGTVLSCTKWRCLSFGRKKTNEKGWKFSKGDIEKVQEVVDYKLGEKRILQQIHLYNTNKVEAFHQRCFALNPKSKTNKTTYHARNYYAAAIDSKGIKRANMHFFQKLALKFNSKACTLFNSFDREKLIEAGAAEIKRVETSPCRAPIGKT